MPPAEGRFTEPGPREGIAAQRLSPDAVYTTEAKKGGNTVTPELEEFLRVWDMETATTRKLIAAVPEAKRDFRPHEKARSARELAWHLVGAEKFFIEGCLARAFQFKTGPDAPASIGEILVTLDRQHPELMRNLRQADDQRFQGTVKFYVAPKQMGDMPVMAILWGLVVMHSVHHRGQLSAYLRIMGEKVPSIYGPSLDEPWM
jgi:uncharacterized damage-inducible protein DinB